MARVLALLACSASACFFAPDRPMDGVATSDARTRDGNGGGGDGAPQDGPPTGICNSEMSDEFSNGATAPCGTWGTEYIASGVMLERDGQQLLVAFGGGGAGGCFVHEHVITNGVSVRVDLAYLSSSSESFELQLTAPMQSPQTSAIVVSHDGSGRLIGFNHAGAAASPTPYNGPSKTVFRIVPTQTSVIASYLNGSEWVQIGDPDLRDARGLGSALFFANGLDSTQAAFDDLNVYTCPP